MASSRIEGLGVGARGLRRAVAARDLGPPAEVTAVEVLGNIDAMAHAIEQVGPGDPIAADLTLGPISDSSPGRASRSTVGTLREQQNWVGVVRTTPVAHPSPPRPDE